MIEENAVAANKQGGKQSGKIAPPYKKHASFNGVTRGREAFHFFLAAIPVLGFLIFGLVPLVLSLALSFTNVKMSILDEFTFVGIQNFVTLAKNVYFKKSIVNTLYYTLNVPLSIALGLFIAYLVNKAMKGKYFFRSVFFIPYVCSTVSMAVAWKIMYDKEYGIINTLLSSFGVAQIGWITTPQTFMLSTIIMSVWSGTGFCVILYQAALANVNTAYYESAKIDGASNARVFFSISLPAVSPTTFYLLTMKLIGSLQVMAEPDILSGGNSTTGGLNWADMTVVKFLYKTFGGSWNSIGFGVGSAAALILTVFIALVTWINFRLGKKWVNYDMA